MKGLLHFLVVVMLVFASASSAVCVVDRNYINQLVPRIKTLDRESVVENDYGYSFEDVIGSLRELDEEYTASHSRLLIRLRDEFTIEKYLTLFRESKGVNRGARQVLASSYSPWLIPPLVDYLDAQSIELRMHESSVGNPYWGLSAHSARIIRITVLRSEEFSDETREWVEELPYRNTEGLKELRDTLTVWWEENQAHFENEEYHLVRPVSWELEEDAARDEEPERYLESTLELGEQDLGLEEEESEEAFPPQSSDEEPEMEKSGRSPWPWVFGAVVLVLLALGVLRMRSKGSGS